MVADKEGHLICKIGDTLQGRYQILEKLGEGAFGRVFKVLELSTNKERALKIVKNIVSYREAAKIEIRILEKLADKRATKHFCVRFYDSMTHLRHPCLEFEMLGLSVFDFMRDNNYEPYPLKQVRHIAYQLCHAVKFLHDNKVIHTDLKPENFLFVNSDYSTTFNARKDREIRRVKCTDIRLIDFGSAVLEDESHGTVITTRPYRAPEVILELGWDKPSDVWSIGCIVKELFSGTALIQLHNSYDEKADLAKDMEHILLLEGVLGKIPSKIARKSKKKIFAGKRELGLDPEVARHVEARAQALESFFPSKNEDDMQLLDIVQKMLKYDSAERMTMSQALRHAFFQKLPPQQRLKERA